MPGPPLLRRQDHVGGRQPTAARVLDRDAGVDQLKGEFRGAAEKRLDVLGIVDPGKLDKDAIRSLSLDSRFLGSGLVDAAPDDRDRLIDRLAPPRFGRNRAE